MAKEELIKQYEEERFAPYYWHPQGYNKEHIGQAFRVLGRDEDRVGWIVQLADKTILHAGPESVIPHTMMECGCPDKYLTYTKVGSYNQETGEVQKEAYGQGYVFKDEEAYRLYPNRPCYVPEYSESGKKFTRIDILRLCNYQEDFAWELFCHLDWQHPGTLLDEYLKTGEWGYCPYCGKLFHPSDDIQDYVCCPDCGAESNPRMAGEHQMLLSAMRERPDYRFYIQELKEENFRRQLAIRQLNNPDINGECIISGAVMEIGYYDITVMIRAKDPVHDKTPVINYLVCHRLGNGSWEKDGELNCTVDVDWMSPVWLERLVRDMFFHLYDYVDLRGGSFDFPHKPVWECERPKQEVNISDASLVAFDIQWDTDGEEVDLPQEIEVPAEVFEEAISDYITEQTGFCHKGFRVKTKL